MAIETRTLELGYDRYSEKDRRELRKKLRSLGAYVHMDIGAEDLLIDRKMYHNKKDAYTITANLSHLVKEEIDFTRMRSGIYDGVVKLFDIGDILIHLFEIPISEVPLYINSRSEDVILIAKWRLERGC